MESDDKEDFIELVLRDATEEEVEYEDEEKDCLTDIILIYIKCLLLLLSHEVPYKNCFIMMLNGNMIIPPLGRKARILTASSSHLSTRKSLS